MTDISTDYSTHLTAAVNPEGFIDFYELLGVPGDAAQDLINTRINDLYSRSQDNREHRHLAKRREAEVLLSLMPHCMDVLLNPTNRAAYDAYAVSARAGSPPTDFETFMNEVIKDGHVVSAGLLAVRDKNGATPATSRNGAHLNGASPNGASNALASAAGVSSTAQRNATMAAAPARKVNYGAVLVTFIGIFVLCDLGLALPPVVTIVASAFAAWFSHTLQRRAPQSATQRGVSARVSL